MTTAYKKGDIYHVAYGQVNSVGDEIWSDRPALIISNDVSNKYSGVVTVVYLTTSKNKRIRPTHVPLLSGNTKALALCEQMYTVDKSRLSDYIGSVTEEEMSQVESALMFQLAVNPATRPTSIFKKWENYIIRNRMNIDKYNVPEKAVDTPQTIQIFETSSKPYITILRDEIQVLTEEVNKYKQLYDNCKNYLADPDIVNK